MSRSSYLLLLSFVLMALFLSACDVNMDQGMENAKEALQGAEDFAGDAVDGVNGFMETAVDGLMNS
jgi:hypothetical protein